MCRCCNGVTQPLEAIATSRRSNAFLSRRLTFTLNFPMTITGMTLKFLSSLCGMIGRECPGVLHEFPSTRWSFDRYPTVSWSDTSRSDSLLHVITCSQPTDRQLCFKAIKYLTSPFIQNPSKDWHFVAFDSLHLPNSPRKLCFLCLPRCRPQTNDNLRLVIRTTIGVILVLTCTCSIE